MEKKTRKEIVTMLLNQNLEIENEQDLIELLIDDSAAIDVDKEEDLNRSKGDILADKITEFAGSWKFIAIILLFLISWILFNTLTENPKDPYPFILLNLILSCLAVFQAPFILMSQNRQAKKDSLRSKNDYKTDLKSEIILEELHHQLNEIIKNQQKKDINK